MKKKNVVMTIPRNNGSYPKLAYNFTSVSDTETEIEIYDDIANKRTRDWWTGEETGTQVTPNSFKEELNAVTTQNITVRINSSGGVVSAANTIASAIQEARSKGKKITCKIDGMCASAAVQIALSCEKVSIHRGAYMMIHNPMVYMYGYMQAKDLQSHAEYLNTIKRGIMSLYKEKTGKDEKEISDLMDAETWMTGEEAVEKGFADSLMFDDSNDDEVINRISTLVAMNSVYNIPTELQSRLQEQKGVQEMPINSVEDLIKEYPDFVNQIRNDAVASVSHDEAIKDALNAERGRMKAIDDMAGKVDSALLNKAKYETFDSAEKVALEAITNGNFVNTSVLDALAKEGANNSVGAVPNAGIDNGKQSKDDAKNKASEIAKAHLKSQGKGVK